MNGQMFLSPEVSNLVIADYKHRLAHDSGSVEEALTTRERDILQSIAEGKSTRSIAGELHVSIKTIETHRQHIMAKLELHSVADLTRFALREGLIQPNQ
jgi:DNA-binding NarL/FixJ family response regulator